MLLKSKDFRDLNQLGYMNSPLEKKVTGPIIRAVTKALIGGGGGYSYTRVLTDEFLLKSAVITVDFKRNWSCRMRIYEYAPPINPLVTALPIIFLRGVAKGGQGGFLPQ